MIKAIYSDYFKDKVDLRLHACNDINKDEIKVLNCYAGKNEIWQYVNKKTHKKIHTFNIDIDNTLKDIDYIGDNIKYLKQNSLSNYDIIDLDSFGSCTKQLEIIFAKKYIGTIVCTFISTALLNPDRILADKYGYTRNMVKKAKSLHARKTFEMFYNYLATNGVTSIMICDAPKKKYIYFKTT